MKPPFVLQRSWPSCSALTLCDRGDTELVGNGPWLSAGTFPGRCCVGQGGLGGLPQHQPGWETLKQPFWGRQQE